jgi:hypothetical protein
MIQAVAHWLAVHKESSIKDVTFCAEDEIYNLKGCFNEIFDVTKDT